jgi:hypothetical protein
MLLREWWCGNTMGCQHCRKPCYRRRFRSNTVHSSEQAPYCELGPPAAHTPLSTEGAATTQPKRDQWPCHRPCDRDCGESRNFSKSFASSSLMKSVTPPRISNACVRRSIFYNPRLTAPVALILITVGWPPSHIEMAACAQLPSLCGKLNFV